MKDMTLVLFLASITFLSNAMANPCAKDMEVHCNGVDAFTIETTGYLCLDNNVHLISSGCKEHLQKAFEKERPCFTEAMKYCNGEDLLIGNRKKCLSQVPQAKLSLACKNFFLTTEERTKKEVLSCEKNYKEICPEYKSGASLQCARLLYFTKKLEPGCFATLQQIYPNHFSNEAIAKINKIKPFERFCMEEIVNLCPKKNIQVIINEKYACIKASPTKLHSLCNSYLNVALKK